MAMEREQLEFMMSQAIDGDLPADQAEELERYLADHPEDRAEFERMRKLNDLLGAWGQQTSAAGETDLGRRLGEQIRDEPAFAISRMIDGEEAAEADYARYAEQDPGLGLRDYAYRRLETVLRAWGAIEPPVDHDLLYERLCETIHLEAGGGAGRWTRWVIRLGAPLAAAASLLIVAGLWWSQPDADTAVPGPSPLQAQPQVQVALAGPPKIASKEKAVVKVSFGIASDAPIQSVARAEGTTGVVISIGGFERQDEQGAQPQGEMVF